MTPPPKLPVRQRLLAAADDLFYNEGVQTVGVDRVIEQADVAKATLYRTFGNKEQLVAAYLRARHEAYRSRLAQSIERESDPRARILAVFDSQIAWINRKGWRGCAFARASAEPSVGPLVQREADEYRADIRALLTDLAAAAGASAPAMLGWQLSLLYHGVAVEVEPVKRRSATAALRAAVETLIDAAITDGGSATDHHRG
jgi:AcrR family transcriptional regulator